MSVLINDFSFCFGFLVLAFSFSFLQWKTTLQLKNNSLRLTALI